jgi:hypothetical protein
MSACSSRLYCLCRNDLQATARCHRIGQQKCLVFGERVALLNGSAKAVEHLSPSDILVGQDGRPMRITGLDASNKCLSYYEIEMGELIYRVTPGHLVTLSWRLGQREVSIIEPDATHLHPIIQVLYSDRASLSPKCYTQRFTRPGSMQPARKPQEVRVWPSKEIALLMAIKFARNNWGKHAPVLVTKGTYSYYQVTYYVPVNEGETIQVETHHSQVIAVPDFDLHTTGGRHSPYCKVGDCSARVRSGEKWKRHCARNHSDLCTITPLTPTQLYDHMVASDGAIKRKFTVAVKETSTSFTFHASALQVQLPVLVMSEYGMESDDDLLEWGRLAWDILAGDDPLLPGDLIDVPVEQLLERKDEWWGDENHIAVRAPLDVVPRSEQPVHSLPLPITLASADALRQFARAADATVQLGVGALCHNYNQVVTRSASGEYDFRVGTVSDAHAITWVSHQPLAHTQQQHLNAYGNVAWTMRRMDRALDAIGANIEGTWVSETLPLIGPTGSVHASEPLYDDVCEQVVRAHFASRAHAFIICGEESIKRWSDTLRKIAQDIDLHDVCQLADRCGDVGKNVRGSVMRAGDREFAIILVPHPSARGTDVFRSIARGAACAYTFIGQRVLDESMWEERARLVIPITAVRQVNIAAQYVLLNVAPQKAEDVTGTEADHRFLLANGVLTHNCVKSHST